MIVIRNTVTGELQVVASATGYDSDWTTVADPAPEGPIRWDGTAVVIDLDAAKARQRALINRARDTAQDGGADTPSGRFDSAPRSREFLNGAVTNALLANISSQAFSITWTRADNSSVTMDADETIAAGVAVATWVDTVHNRARVLKDRIDEATTLAAVQAVTWTLTDD
jgi:hypothetical protein